MNTIQKILALIETKTSWGKNELKEKILLILAEEYKQ